jgi:hypothetical protein
MDLIEDKFSPLVRDVIGDGGGVPRLYFFEGLLGPSPNADYVRLYWPSTDTGEPSQDYLVGQNWVDVRRAVVEFVAVQEPNADLPSGWNGVWLAADTVDATGDAFRHDEDTPTAAQVMDRIESGGSMADAGPAFAGAALWHRRWRGWRGGRGI